MPVSSARGLAFDVLRCVEAEGAFAADLLHARLEKQERRQHGLKPEDAALATELALGVLRWQRLLDFLIQRHTKKPAEKLDLEVRLALRIGLYQLRFLTRVPARAAVNESVELVKRARKRSAATLVNAVLRKAAGDATTPIEKLLPLRMPLAERLALHSSHPTWLVERWLARYGEQGTEALLDANNRPPRLTCAVHDAASRDDILASLCAEGLAVEPARWLQSALTVRGGNPARAQAFRDGRISIQDEASQMVALLLAVQQDQSVLDLCAAPGGKTQILARAAGPPALVVAADRYMHRLRIMREQLERTGVPNAQMVALDATSPLPFAAQFDGILVDAPCSGTGTLARNPEIRWRLRPADLLELHTRQVALLRHALEQLKPGGRLVYATCSLEPEENEQVVDEALREARSVRRVRGHDALARHLVDAASPDALFDGGGDFRTFPPAHATDGFFAAVLERNPTTTA